MSSQAHGMYAKDRFRQLALTSTLTPCLAGSDRNFGILSRMPVHNRPQRPQFFTHSHQPRLAFSKNGLSPKEGQDLKFLRLQDVPGVDARRQSAGHPGETLAHLRGSVSGRIRRTNREPPPVSPRVVSCRSSNRVPPDRHVAATCRRAGCRFMALWTASSANPVPPPTGDFAPSARLDRGRACLY
jgi:hypothetical protein